MIVEEIKDKDENLMSVVAVEEIDENFPVGMRVLAVDDNLTCLKILEALLKSCRYDVTTTNQAMVALKMIRENKDKFDLVISDVHMPDMDGFKLGITICRTWGLQYRTQSLQTTVSISGSLQSFGKLLAIPRGEVQEVIEQNYFTKTKFDCQLVDEKSGAVEKGIGAYCEQTGISDAAKESNRKRRCGEKLFGDSLCRLLKWYPSQGERLSPKS